RVHLDENFPAEFENSAAQGNRDGPLAAVLQGRRRLHVVIVAAGPANGAQNRGIAVFEAKILQAQPAQLVQGMAGDLLGAKVGGQTAVQLLIEEEKGIVTAVKEVSEEIEGRQCRGG